MAAYLTIYCDDESDCPRELPTAEDLDLYRAAATAALSGWWLDEKTLKNYCPQHKRAHQPESKTTRARRNKTP